MHFNLIFYMHIFNIKMILFYEINFIKIIFVEDFYWKIIKMNCKLWTTFRNNADINTDQCHNKRKYFLQLYRFRAIYKNNDFFIRILRHVQNI